MATDCQRQLGVALLVPMLDPVPKSDEEIQVVPNWVGFVLPPLLGAPRQFPAFVPAVDFHEASWVVAVSIAEVYAVAHETSVE
ncbi:hypothetical protein GCM10010522_31480 [Kribbella solani]